MRRPLSTISPAPFRAAAQHVSSATTRRAQLARSTGPVRRTAARRGSGPRPDERVQHLGRLVHPRARPVPDPRGGGARPGCVRLGEVRGARAAHRLDGSAVPRRQRRPGVPHPGPGAAQRCRVGRVLPRRRRSGDPAGQRADAAHGRDRADGGHRGQGHRYRPGRALGPGQGRGCSAEGLAADRPGRLRGASHHARQDAGLGLPLPSRHGLGPGVVLGGLGDHRRPSGGPDPHAEA